MDTKTCRGKLFSIDGLPLPSVRRAIEATLVAEGFRVVHKLEFETRFSLMARHSAPWYNVLIQALGQILIIGAQAKPESSEVTICIERRWFTWYKILMAMIAVPVCYFWILGFSGFFHALDGPGQITLRTLILPWIAVILVLFLARMIVSEKANTRLITRLKSKTIEEGAVCEALPSKKLTPQVICATILVLGVIIASAIALSGLSSTWQGTPAEILLIGICCVLVLMIGAAIWALVVSLRRFGADERFAAVAAGFMTATSVLFPAAAQISFRLLGKADSESWSAALEANRLYDSGLDPVILQDGTSVERAEVGNGINRLRLFIGLLLSITGLLILTGSYFFYKGLRGSKTFLDYCRRIHREIDTQAGRAAASAAGYLKNFRIPYVIIWLLYSCLLAIAVVSFADLVVQGIRLANVFDRHLPVGAVLGSARAAEFFLGFHQQSHWVELGARLFWIIAAGSIPCLMVLSVLSFLGSRRRARRRLSQLIENPLDSENQRHLQDQVNDLADRLGFPSPVAILTSSTYPIATSHAFGFRKPMQFIEVTNEAVELLEGSELKAVLAHELAHLVEGHCRKHDMLLVLARLTLVGGAFAGALEDSFGYEQQADSIATQRLGIEPVELQRALVKLQIAGRVGAARSQGMEENSHALQDSAQPRKHRWFLDRVVPYVEAWWLLFTSDASLTYWHPATRERILNLENRER